MNVTPNFQSILDEAPTEVERPKAMPVGTYLCTVGQARYDKSAKKGTPFVEFPLRIIAAEDDVDADLLSEAGSIDGRQIRATYYLTEDSIFRLDEFHEHCGLDLSDPASRRARNEMVLNSQVLAVIKHEPAQDGSDQVFARLARTAPAE